MWTPVVLVIDIQVKIIQQYFFLPSINFLGEMKLNVYMEVLGGHFKSIFLLWYFTIAVILIAQNINSFFDYMLVRPYSFQCKFTKCPNEHICELFCKPQNVDYLICLCKYITPSTVQCSCMHICIHCVKIMHVHGIFDFYFKILLSVWRKWISRKMVVFTQTCMNVVYFTWNICNVSCHFFSSSMDRNDFYLITVIFSEYMTYVCTNFLRFCELEGIEYCYSRWLWMQCIKCINLDEHGQKFSLFPVF